MVNEPFLLLSLLISFGGIIAFFCLFGKSGIYTWTIISTITANIEVLILIKAFGLEQTLGNTLFAATFVATDILSECYGKKSANKAVWLGVASNIIFLLITQSWFLYTPSTQDWVLPSVKNIFSNTPRIMFASLLAYVVSEVFDVWSYHTLWNFTQKKTGSKKKFLWLRNNVATLSAQLINVVLFNIIAFCGMYDAKMLLSICLSSYIIFIATSLIDTPFIYFARWLYGKNKFLFLD